MPPEKEKIRNLGLGTWTVRRHRRGLGVGAAPFLSETRPDVEGTPVWHRPAQLVACTSLGGFLCLKDG